MSEMKALADRVEALEGPDRHLDVLIDEAIGNRVVEPKTPAQRANWPQRISGFTVPKYTASLDAAMTLVPDGERNIGIHRSAMGLDMGGKDWKVHVGKHRAAARTAALALAAACLRAK